MSLSYLIMFSHPVYVRMPGTCATEETVGIAQFVSTSTTGFSGILKQRYSDFIVKEVRINGDTERKTNRRNHSTVFGTPV